MGVCGVICLILCFFGFKWGEIAPALIFGAIGVLLLYLLATKDERRGKKAAEMQRQRELEARIEKNEMRKRAIARFNTAPFVKQLVQDFRSRNWQDLDYSKGGCVIYYDKIVTPYRTYVYINYDLAKLDKNGCQELAEILGMAYKQANQKPYTVKERTRSFGGVSPSYSGSVNSSGEFTVSPDAWSGEAFDGYKLYSDDTVPPPPPTGKAW